MTRRIDFSNNGWMDGWIYFLQQGTCRKCDSILRSLNVAMLLETTKITPASLSCGNELQYLEHICGIMTRHCPHTCSIRLRFRLFKTLMLMYNFCLFRLPSKPTSFATRTRLSSPSNLMSSSKSLLPSVFKRSLAELVSKRCKFFLPHSEPMVRTN
jgi:hypothetical protein